MNGFKRAAFGFNKHGRNVFGLEHNHLIAAAAAGDGELSAAGKGVCIFSVSELLFADINRAACKKTGLNRRKVASCRKIEIVFSVCIAFFPFNAISFALDKRVKRKILDSVFGICRYGKARKGKKERKHNGNDGFHSF